MKRLLLILTVLIWTTNLFGQIQNEVNKVLSDKDFVEFTAYIDSLSHHETRVNFYWKFLRDLTNDYAEGVLYLTKTVPDKKNSAISILYTYRVRLIASNKDIIYFDLSEKKNEKVKKEWVPYYEKIDSYKNDSSFNVLRHSFKQAFSADLNETELFQENIVYGKDCGLIGEDPAEKIKIDVFVSNKDKENLIKWLQSTNTEKQIYAVDGLYQLNHNGILITDNELEMINNVINKKGTINVCNGCVYSRQNIKFITYKFKF